MKECRDIDISRLEKIARNALGQSAPCLLHSVPLREFAQLLNVHAHTARDIDLRNRHHQWPPVARLDFPEEIQHNENGAGKPLLEEVKRAQGLDRCAEASGDTDAGKEDADVGTDDTVLSAVWDLIESAAVVLPRAAEANMGPAHRAPNKEVRDTAEREQPIEELGAGARSFADIRQEAESDLDENTPDGTTLLVDVREPLGAHTAGGEGLHCPRAAKGTAVGDGDDGQENDDVEDRRQDGDTGLHD